MNIIGCRYELWKRDPVAALKAEYAEWEREHKWLRIGPMLSCSYQCCPLLAYRSLVKTRYGGYKNVPREHLEGRTYDIEFWDGKVALFFTDVWYNPRTYTTFPRWLGQPPYIDFSKSYVNEYLRPLT